MIYFVLFAVLASHMGETIRILPPGFYQRWLKFQSAKANPTTAPPTVHPGTLEDVICPSSCVYLMENGYFLKNGKTALNDLCKATVDKYHQQCNSPQALGMESGDIPDSSITASAFHESIYRPEQGRLNFKGDGKKIRPAWEPELADPGEWIQVDLGKEMKVAAVATQGNGKPSISEWTTSYSLKYSSDGQTFEDYDNGRVFQGNFDRNTVVKNSVDPPIVARFIRVIPITWYKWNALRLELYGCSQDASLQLTNESCTERALGMESGAIPDSSITASSYYDDKGYPYEARLYNQYKSGLEFGAWYVTLDKVGSWLQVDLGNITTVSGIATQGKDDRTGYTKSYKLAYSNDGRVFTEYLKGVVLAGNIDRYSVVKRDLIPVINARYIRIYPQSWDEYIALRLELYGCKKD